MYVLVNHIFININLQLIFRLTVKKDVIVTALLFAYLEPKNSLKKQKHLTTQHYMTIIFRWL